MTSFVFRPQGRDGMTMKRVSPVRWQGRLRLLGLDMRLDLIRVSNTVWRLPAGGSESVNILAPYDDDGEDACASDEDWDHWRRLVAWLGTDRVVDLPTIDAPPLRGIYLPVVYPGAPK